MNYPVEHHTDFVQKDPELEASRNTDIEETRESIQRAVTDLLVEKVKRPDWTVEQVAAIGDLPKNPSNKDLIEYAVRNGLLQEGNGIRQLMERAEQTLDRASVSILRAIIDKNLRKRRGKGLAFADTMKSLRFETDPRRIEHNPRKFLNYAEAELNDMMGAWVITQGEDKDNPPIRSTAYKAISAVEDSQDPQKAQELLSTLGESGIKRILVLDTMNSLSPVESRRHGVYYWDLINCGPLNELKKLASQNQCSGIEQGKEK